jgi:homoserine O-acetyltransferase
MIDVLEKAIVETKRIRLYTEEEPFEFECGKSLGPVDVAYETYGTLKEDGTNAILVCHALTGSAHAAFYNSPSDKIPGWWDFLIGPGKALDTEDYFVICSNVLGGCYGTTGPTSLNPSTMTMYGNEFPQMTIRDMVKVQKKLLDYLGVKQIQLIIGGSMGGMQVLEWLVSYPDMVKNAVPIATGPAHTPWGIALNEVARQAILNDMSFKRGDGRYGEVPNHGLALARMIGMISYRSPESFLARFNRQRVFGDAGANRFDRKNLFQVESYLHYQGSKLVERFDPLTYLYLTYAMDLHDISYNRGRMPDVLAGIKSRVLCIGIDTDMLYPSSEQRALAEMIPNAVYYELHSMHGHDAFLIEHKILNDVIKQFLSGTK